MEPYVVTPEGLERMKLRLKQIREFDRPQNVRDIEEARAHGDLRENAEYHAAKERQGFLNDELGRLEDRIARAQVVDIASLSGDKIVFGATVTILNLDTDEEVTYRIVGEDESDTKSGSVSYKAPLAKALIGRRVGDEVIFSAPGGSRTYEVVSVEFIP